MIFLTDDIVEIQAIGGNKFASMHQSTATTQPSSPSEKGKERSSLARRLPQQVASVQRQTLAMANSGWDINALHVIHLRLEDLAGYCGQVGLKSASSALFQFKVLITSFIDSGGVPDDSQAETLLKAARDLDQFGGCSDDVAVRRERAPRALKLNLPEPEIDISGLPSLENIPAFIAPPSGFVPEGNGESASSTHKSAPPQSPPEIASVAAGTLLSGADQFEFDGAPEDSPESDGHTDASAAGDITDDDLDLEPFDLDDEIDALLSEDDEAEFAPQSVPESAPEPDSQREPEPRAGRVSETPFVGEESADVELQSRRHAGPSTLYILHSNNSMSGIVHRLEMACDIQTFDDVEEFLEVLGALGPDAVLIDEAHFDHAVRIGAIVQKLRAKSQQVLPFIAVGETQDVSARLALMRAGADAYMGGEPSADAIVDRVRELLDSAPAVPYRVLIAEDDRSQALFAQSILKRAGLEVTMEGDPLEVPRRIEEFRPDLILMDLHMPGCDGMELTAIIRENEDFVNVPIVFLSGEDDVDTHFDALLAGGDDFLTKPIKPRHLISAVKSRVRRARAAGVASSVEPEESPESGFILKSQFLDQVTDALSSLDQNPDSPAGGLVFVELDQPFELRRQVGLSGLDALSEQLGPMIAELIAEGQDLVARFGDHSYCVFMKGVSDLALERKARQIVDAAAAHRFAVAEGSIAATVSAGVVTLTSDLKDGNAAIGRAEHECTREFDRGVSRVSVYQPESENDEAAELRNLGEEILDALDNDRLQLVFQPVASLQGTDVEHYHCLLRMPRSDGTFVSPLTVLQAADALGMQAEVDRWVLEQALAVLKESASRPKTLRLFVNQSVATTEDDTLADWLSGELEARSLTGSNLILEFKLPEIVESLSETVLLSQQLEMLGVRVCVGAFDGSQEAFAAMEHVKPKFVKLERALAERSKELMSVVERLHEKHHKVIVPAVEEARIAVSLWSAGVDFIQGNFVQSPSPELDYQFANVM